MMKFTRRGNLAFADEILYNNFSQQNPFFVRKSCVRVVARARAVA